MRRIDTHQHFWRYRPDEYPWIDPLGPLARDFLPEDFEPLLHGAGFHSSIVVQARHRIPETEWLLELADSFPFIAGVIGWVDLCADDVERQLDLLVAHPKLVGIRHIVHDEPDELFMLRDDFLRGMAALGERGLTYDLLLFPRHLPAAVELVEAFPDQPFVLDHLAKPDIRRGERRQWAADLERLARFPQVCAKISGLVTEADWELWTSDDLGPYIQTAYDCFGADRLMVGSDWPVCTLAGDYGRTMAATMDFVSRLPAAEQEALLGGNAIRVWDLDRRRGVEL